MQTLKEATVVKVCSPSKALAAAIGAMTLISIGCRESPPPRRVEPPPRNADYGLRETEQERPIIVTEPQEQDYAPDHEDVPLVNQRTPEERAFVDAYKAVGRPRMVVFVNRTLEGQTIPVNPNEPLISYQYSRRATTGVSVERRTTETNRDRWYDDRRDSTDRFNSDGPGEYRETTEVYLRPGQYDEINARTLDYEAVENILTDWLSASQQATIISPMMARQRLTEQEVTELQEGRPQVLSEIVNKLGADVLVHVQAHPTRQTPQGLHVRLVAEAINTQGGQSIGRAVVDLPPPLEKTMINRYTRFLARKLMDGMTNSWNSMPPEQAPATNQAR